MSAAASQNICTCNNLFEPMAPFHAIGCRYRMEFAADLRARLSLEQRDEPREHFSNIEPNTGLRRHGEI